MSEGHAPEGDRASSRSVFHFVTDWLEPEANPAGVVYGVLAIGTLIAAEGARRETALAVITASTLALVLYWLAHAYSRHFAARLETPEEFGHRWIGPALAREASMLKGAALPVIVLLLCSIADAPLSTAVNAALWTAGAELVVLELMAGIRRRLGGREIVLEVGLGVLLGGGVLAIRLLLS